MQRLHLNVFIAFLWFVYCYFHTAAEDLGACTTNEASYRYNIRHNSPWMNVCNTSMLFLSVYNVAANYWPSRKCEKWHCHCGWFGLLLDSLTMVRLCDWLWRCNKCCCYWHFLWLYSLFEFARISKCVSSPSCSFLTLFELEQSGFVLLVGRIYADKSDDDGGHHDTSTCTFDYASIFINASAGV